MYTQKTNNFIVTTYDTELDGTTPYEVVGDVDTCASTEEVITETYNTRLYDLQDDDTWTPADLPVGVELIEISFTVIVDSATNGVINSDATVIATLPTGYSWHSRSDEDNGILVPPQVIDSGPGGRIIVDATWRI